MSDQPLNFPRGIRGTPSLRGSSAPLAPGYLNEEAPDELYHNVLASLSQTSHLAKSEASPGPRKSRGSRPPPRGTVEIGVSMFDNRLKNLRIYDLLPTLVEKVRSSDNPLAVMADTGSGKSLGVIAALYQAHRNDPSFRTFIAVPTRTAAYNLYLQLGSLIGGKGIVGYQADRQSVMEETTQIIYVTYGRLKGIILSYLTRIRTLSPDNIPSLMSHVILDEIHQLSIDAIMVMTVVGYLVRTYPVVKPKIILLSATLPHHANIEGYLGTVIPITYTVERTHSLTIKYHHRSFGTGEGELTPENERALYQDTAEVVKTYHYQESSNHYPFLVFAAGKREIDTIATLIEEFHLPSTVVMRITGSVDRDQISDIYRSRPQRKIIVTTNVVESAVTINHVILVVDTLREKVMTNDTIIRNMNAGIDDVQRLRPAWIDRQSATQRAGRTGRTIAGICYRMSTREFFESLPEEKDSELSRVSLYTPVLNLMAAHIDPHQLLIQKSSIARYQQTLGVMGLLNGDTVTPAGLLASRLPLGVRNSRLLWEWVNSFPAEGYLAVVIANLIEYGSSLFRVPSFPEASPGDLARLIARHVATYYKKYQGRDDLEVMIKVWDDYTRSKSRNPYQYSKTNQLIARQFLEMVENIDGTIRIINGLTSDQKSKFNFPVTTPLTKEWSLRKGYQRACFFLEGSDDSGDSAVIPAGVDRRSYHDQLMTRGNGLAYRLVGEKGNYYLNNRGAVSSLAENPPPCIVALSKYTIEGKGTTPLRIVNMAIAGPLPHGPSLASLLTFEAPSDISSPSVPPPLSSAALSPPSSAALSPSSLTYRDLVLSFPPPFDITNVINYAILIQEFRHHHPEVSSSFSALVLTLRGYATDDDLYPSDSSLTWDLIAQSSLPPDLQTEWGSLLAAHRTMVLTGQYPHLVTMVEVAEQTKDSHITFHYEEGSLSVPFPPGVINTLSNRLDPSLSEPEALMYVGYLGLLYWSVLPEPNQLILPLSSLLPFSNYGFTTLDTPLLTNEFLPLGGGAHGLFPSFESLFIPPVESGPTIVILPPNQAIINQYLATLRDDIVYLFIYRDEEQEYYSSLTPGAHQDSYQALDFHRQIMGVTTGLTYAIVNGSDELLTAVAALVGSE